MRRKWGRSSEWETDRQAGHDMRAVERPVNRDCTLTADDELRVLPAEADFVGRVAAVVAGVARPHRQLPAAGRQLGPVLRPADRPPRGALTGPAAGPAARLPRPADGGRRHAGRRAPQGVHPAGDVVGRRGGHRHRDERHDWNRDGDGMRRDAAGRGGTRRDAAGRGGTRRYAAVRGGMRRDAAGCGGMRRDEAGCGGMRRDAAGCGGMRRDAAGCGGMRRDAAG